MIETLENCPFCGNEPKFESDQYNINPYRIACYPCGILTTWQRHPDTLVKSWNTRTFKKPEISPEQWKTLPDRLQREVNYNLLVEHMKRDWCCIECKNKDAEKLLKEIGE